MRASRRNRLNKNQFGQPGSRKYPVDTRGRAINAKARATQQWKKGKLSKTARDRIVAKANRALGKKSGKKR